MRSWARSSPRGDFAMPARRGYDQRPGRSLLTAAAPKPPSKLNRRRTREAALGRGISVVSQILAGQGRSFRESRRDPITTLCCSLLAVLGGKGLRDGYLAIQHGPARRAHLNRVHHAVSRGRRAPRVSGHARKLISQLVIKRMASPVSAACTLLARYGSSTLLSRRMTTPQIYTAQDPSQVTDGAWPGSPTWLPRTPWPGVLLPRLHNAGRCWGLDTARPAVRTMAPARQDRRRCSFRSQADIFSKQPPPE